MGLKERVRAVFAVFALLFAYQSARTIMNGDLEGGLTPGWVDFATSHPVLFAVVLVIGAVVIGAPFVAAVDNF